MKLEVDLQGLDVERVRRRLLLKAPTSSVFPNAGSSGNSVRRNSRLCEERDTLLLLLFFTLIGLCVIARLLRLQSGFFELLRT